MSRWVCCILVNCRVIWVLPLQNQHFAWNHHLEGCELFDQQRELFLKLLISQTNIFDGDEVLSYKNGHKLYYFQPMLGQNSFIRVQVFPHLLSNLCAERVENKFLSTKHLKREKGVISVKKEKRKK